MVLGFLQFIFFIFSLSFFGFIFLSQINKIKSLILLIPFSISFGVASYLFVFHLLAFLIGPRSATILALCLLIVISVIILLVKNKKFEKINSEITKNQYLILLLVCLFIFIPTFLAYKDYGNGEKSIQYPTLLTIFHNNTYPPKDFYKSEYYLLYHYLSTMLPGAIYHLCKLPISYSFSIIGSILFTVYFLSIFAISWLLTKKYKLSLGVAICSYFADGLLWIDAIFRHLTKNLPPFAENWGFLETFCYLGMHSGMSSGPMSQGPIAMAITVGMPLILLCIVFLHLMLEETNLKRTICHLIVLSILLCTVLLVEESLIAALGSGIFLYSILLSIKRKKRELILLFSLLLILFVFNKIFGLQSLICFDDTQLLGKLSLYDIKFKENLFQALSYRKLNVGLESLQPVSFFSWEFFCEFVPIIMLPVIIIYVLRTKSSLITIPFLGALVTFPIPLLLECPVIPPLFNRFFIFSKGFIVILGFLAIATLIQNSKLRKLVFFIYAFPLLISSFLQFTSSAIFSPNIYINPTFIEKAVPILRTGDFKKYYEFAKDYTIEPFWKYKGEIDFLKKNSKPFEKAISNFYQLPAHAGLYTIIPPSTYIIKDLTYSRSDNTYQVVFATLDPHLLNELNLKWLVIDRDFKRFLTQEALNVLTNKEICTLAHKQQNKLTKETIEIYYINNLKDYLTKFKRKTAWLLTTNQGMPIEVTRLTEKNITLFATSKEAINHLKYLHSKYPELKKDFIISKVVPIEEIEKQIKDTNLSINLIRKF